MALLIISVPLSEMTVLGLPRLAIKTRHLPASLM
jgi:hypothetical protein